MHYFNSTNAYAKLFDCFFHKFFCASVSPRRRQKGKMKSVGQCSVYLTRGIAKRLSRNKQSTPRIALHRNPLAGVDTGKHERS